MSFGLTWHMCVATCVKFGPCLVHVWLLKLLLTLCPCSFSAASERKIGWAFRIFDNWQKAQNLRTKLEGCEDNICGCLEDMEDQDLCDNLCKFIVEVCKVSGEPYPIVIMLQMYLETKGRHVWFLDPQSIKFVKVCNTLDNRMKCLSREGYITPKSKAQVIALSQEEKLWSNRLLGDHTPERLVYTVLYLLGVQFALQAGEEHKSLKFGKQLSVQFDTDSGNEYLEYVEFTAKNNQGGLSAMKATGKVLQCYRNPDSDCCLVTLYKKYAAAQPVKNVKCSQDFYLRPLAKFNADGIGYSCQPLGIHKIESAIKNLCLEADIKGKRTNHSLRVTSATHLYEAEMDKQLIQERTGHRSNAVWGYKRTSTNLQKKVCQTLYGAKASQSSQDTVILPPPTPTPATQPVPVTPTVNSEVSNTPLYDSPEGQRMETLLNAANMTFRQALAAPVLTLDSGLLSAVIDFVCTHGRPQQAQTNSDHAINLHLHFHV